MTAPSQKVRGWTYLRDGFLCINCGSFGNLSWQHREASGQGGRGSKAPALRTADGVTLCLICNEACEAEMQDKALAFGWKIRRNRGSIEAGQIPFYDCNTREWYLPQGSELEQFVPDGPYRTVIPAALAQELLLAAGNLQPGREVSV